MGYLFSFLSPKIFPKISFYLLFFCVSKVVYLFVSRMVHLESRTRPRDLGHPRIVAVEAVCIVVVCHNSSSRPEVGVELPWLEPVRPHLPRRRRWSWRLEGRAPPSPGWLETEPGGWRRRRSERDCQSPAELGLILKPEKTVLPSHSAPHSASEFPCFSNCTIICV